MLLLIVYQSVIAQTLQEGRNLFAAGDYEAAMPIMKKYLKQSPNDASRNYWYGACLYETGNRDEDCRPYLEKAAQKKIIKAYRYLALYHNDRADYQAAIDSYESLIKGMKADKSLHNDSLETIYEAEVERLKRTYRLFRNTARICFIDSFAVAKDNFLQTYMLDTSVGSIGRYSDHFGDDAEGDVFKPETGGRIYFTRQEPDNGLFQLYQAFHSPDGWIDATQLRIGGDSADIRYPFVKSDGVTIYYASNGPESIGGYDIYVTRYNTNTGGYLVPENIGMPFNSSANDYMYVVDEVNGLGWFATDRNQPEDSVCVYVFIPDDSRTCYDLEQDSLPLIARASRLVSIEETQTDQEAVRTSRQKLTLLAYSNLNNESRNNSAFVIDDFTDYHKADDFKSGEARALFTKWQDMRKRLDESKAQLKQKRDDWAESTKRERESQRAALLKLESDTEALERDIRDTEVRIRNTEIEFLSH